MAIVVESKTAVPTLTLPDLPIGTQLWSYLPVSFTDFQPNAGVTGTINLLARPAEAIVSGVIIRGTTIFAGPTLSAATLAVGDGGGSTTQYSPARDVFATPGDALAFESSVSMSGAGASEGIFMLNAGVADNFTATLTLTGEIIDDLTAGAVDIWILWTTAPKT